MTRGALRWARSQHIVVKLLIAGALIAGALVAFVATALLWGHLDFGRLLQWAGVVIIAGTLAGLWRARRFAAYTKEREDG